MDKQTTEFEMRVCPTSYRIFPGKEAMEKLSQLISRLEFEDEFQDDIIALGYMLDEDRDMLYLHRGVNLEYLRNLLQNVRVKYVKAVNARPMNSEHEEFIPPRNKEQIDVINFIAGLDEHSANVNSQQLFLVKTGGFGKTYCAGRAACLYNQKTLIIMHRDQLREQWKKSLHDLQGLTSDDVYEITTSEQLEEIANGYDPDHDIYLMTHATFRAGIKRIRNLKKISRIPQILGIGLKIIDEAHLEFRDTLMMDFLFNIHRNLYLTATDGRSSKDENVIFKHVFSNTLFYKPSSLLTKEKPKKWVEYNIVEINTHALPQIVRYRVEGYRGKMSPASYGKWVIQYDKKKTHIKCVTEIVRIIYERDSTAKVLIFMPLIELCEEVAYHLRKHLNYDESFAYDLNIQTVNSKNSKTENEENKHADVIVTTIGSCGTGTDIPGVTAIISCSPFVSTLTAKQVAWRLRYCGKKCYYYDIYDSSVKMDKYWIRSRSKTISALALETKFLQWTPDDDENIKN